MLIDEQNHNNLNEWSEMKWILKYLQFDQVDKLGIYVHTWGETVEDIEAWGEK